MNFDYILAALCNIPQVPKHPPLTADARILLTGIVMATTSHPEADLNEIGQKMRLHPTELEFSKRELFHKEYTVGRHYVVRLSPKYLKLLEKTNGLYADFADHDVGGGAIEPVDPDLQKAGSNDSDRKGRQGAGGRRKGAARAKGPARTAG